MKKAVIIILILLFSFSLIWSYSYQEELDIIQGKENIATFIKSKPISIILTTNNMMYMNKNFDKWLNEYNQKKIDEGEKDKVLDKGTMIKEMEKIFAKEIKSDGGKWKLKLINDKSEAKDGYIININIEQVNPIPMVSFSARYTFTAYKVGSDDALFKVKLTSSLQKIEMFVVVIGLPEDCLKDAQELLSALLIKFLKEGTEI